MVIWRVGLAVKMAMLMDALLTEWLLVLHAKSVDWHVMFIAVEHSRLLLRQSLIENLLGMVHLLLMMHLNWLLSMMD